MTQRPLTQAELLNWAVLHTATAGEDAPPRPSSETASVEPIDPKWIDVLLGKGDAMRMRECVERISNASLSEDERIEAFDELEMLVESLDNANDLRPLQLWKPIIAMLRSENDRLRMYAAWVLGTAVQNNPKSQTDFLETGGLEPVLHALESDSSSDVRAKAMYCISGALRHNRQAFLSFNSLRGFSAIVSAFHNAEPALMRRAVFFWTSLLTSDDTQISQIATTAAVEHGVARMALQLAESACDNVDMDLMEKCVELITALVQSSVASVSVSDDAVDEQTQLAIMSSLVPKVRAQISTMEAAGEDVVTIRQLIDRLSDLVSKNASA